MFVSKHHYAKELAQAGNTVYFLNPPDVAKKKAGVFIHQPEGLNNLYLVDQVLWFPYNLKFHAKGVFDLLMKRHVKNILQAISKPIDIVWSFDLGNLYSFRFFDSNAIKIFHPVDEPLTRDALRSGEGADIVFSVTQEILDKYQHLPVSRHLVNHGVGDLFLEPASAVAGNLPVVVGLSGNLLRNDIDRESLLQIIAGNPNLQFECWGAYQLSQTNIGGDQSEATTRFIEQLKSFPNVHLNGVLPAAELKKAYEQVSVFLICYDINKDQSKGTNYHKIMEFLSTGKTIVSNNVTTYKDRNDLVIMTKSRTDNNDLPRLFAETVVRLNEHNSEHLQQRRKAFAAENTYANQIKKIDQLLAAWIR